MPPLVAAMAMFLVSTTGGENDAAFAPPAIKDMTLASSSPERRFRFTHIRHLAKLEPSAPKLDRVELFRLPASALLNRKESSFAVPWKLLMAAWRRNIMAA